MGDSVLFLKLMKNLEVGLMLRFYRTYQDSIIKNLLSRNQLLRINIDNLRNIVAWLEASVNGLDNIA